MENTEQLEKETFTAAEALPEHDDMLVLETPEGTSKKKKFCLNSYSTALTLIFSFLLVSIGFLQYEIYARQADIAETSNLLSKYQYRYEYYQKLKDKQKEVSIDIRGKEIPIEEFATSSYNILSLLRESEMLFDENISNDINKILSRHLELLTVYNNGEISDDDYLSEMYSLVEAYGLFMDSDDFKKQLDINAIK